MFIAAFGLSKGGVGLNGNPKALWHGLAPLRRRTHVILFYAILIGGGGLGLALIVAFLLGPIRLLARRFGTWAGVAFAFVLGRSLVLFYEPPYGGLSLSFIPPGMLPMVFINGWIQEPPIRMLLAAASVSAAGFAILLLSRFARRP